MRRRQLERGFTLIELLVVISIIFVLASILLPVLGAVTRNARTAICASNERQVVAACLAYSASNNGRMITPAIGWAGTDGSADFVTGVIWPYLAPSIPSRMAIMHCPADTLEQYCSYGGVDVIPPPYRNFSYSLNISLSTAPPGGPVGIILSQVQNPGGHVMLYEEFAPNDDACYGPGDLDDWLTGRHGGPGTIEHRAAYIDIAWTNEGRGNVGYFDGHVALMSVNGYFSNTYHFGPLNQ